jgi:hypothetical protein
MIKEPEDEAFDDLEKAQQRNALLVDKGCAERGCMGYDDRDGDKPVKMRVFDDDDIQDYKKPWRSLSDAQYQHILKQTEGCGHLAFYNLIEKALRELNT